MKKLLSILLSFSLLFVPIPQISNAESFADKNIGGMYEKRTSNEENINCYRIGNKIYVNGVLEATIVENNLSNNININKVPDGHIFRTGWMYTETCPYGTESEYTHYISSRNKNIQFERNIASYTTIALSGIIGKVFSSYPQAVLIGIAGHILSNIPGSNYGDLKTLYFKEDIYSHESLGSVYRKNVLNFYFDSNFSEYATREVMYSWWG